MPAASLVPTWFSAPHCGRFLALYSILDRAAAAHLESGRHCPELFAGLCRWSFRHALQTIRDRTNTPGSMVAIVSASPQTPQFRRAANTRGRTVAIAPALYCPKRNLSAAFLVPPFF